MKILVTGAAGDIGSHLTDALLSQGHKVRALVRNLHEASAIRKPGVEVFMADISDPKTLDGAAIDIDATYHLAAALFVVDPEETLRTINYEGTINVANECISKGAKRFIFPSFPLVLGPHKTPSQPIRVEAMDVRTSSYHALYKRLCEQHLTVLNDQGKLAVTILRLGTVYGPDIRLIRILKNFMLRGLYRIPGTGDNISHFVHIDDVVQAMLRVLTNEKAIGQIYNVADDKPVRFKEFVYELADLLNVPRPKSAPVWLFRLAATLLTTWAQLSKSPPLINNDVITLNISDFAADTQKTKADLGFAPRYPTIYDGLPTCVTAATEEQRPVAG